MAGAIPGLLLIFLLVWIHFSFWRWRRRRRASATAPPRSSPVVATVERERPSVVCPFCKDSIGAVRVACQSCGTDHHATCFEENQGCAVFGCREHRGRASVRERA